MTELGKRLIIGDKGPLLPMDGAGLLLDAAKAGHAEAEAASATAKKLGMISLAIVAVLIVLYFIFIFAMVGLASSGF